MKVMHQNDQISVTKKLNTPTYHEQERAFQIMKH